MYDRVTKKIIIDPYRGGEDIGNSINNIIEKDYNLKLSKYIYERLKSLGIPVSITRDNDETLNFDDRISRIKEFYGSGNDVIVISNALTTGGDGAEIVYALRNSSGLSEKLANELKKIGINTSKYYQRRLPSDTAKDYYKLIRDTSNNESLIIFYGNIDNKNEALFLENNLESVGEAVVIALSNYLDINYKPASDNDYYTVKKGDTLYGVANKYNTTVSELKSLNNLVSNSLNIGDVLKIPTNNIEELPNDGKVIYTIKSGDTLYSIARKYNTTVDKIKTLNNLTNNTLSIGTNLTIPSNDNEEINNNYLTYKVISGDTLYSIARKYNTSIDKIKSINNLTNNNLSINQVLKIPVNNDYITYKVVSGDSLYSIAKRYNTTVNEIKTLNNLNSSLLSIGTILKVPN